MMAGGKVYFLFSNSQGTSPKFFVASFDSALRLKPCQRFKSLSLHQSITCVIRLMGGVFIPRSFWIARGDDDINRNVCLLCQPFRLKAIAAIGNLCWRLESYGRLSNMSEGKKMIFSLFEGAVAGGLHPLLQQLPNLLRFPRSEANACQMT